MQEGGGKYWTHKQVAKWMKSKGRGKLKNYCTMCGRQFRDNNGIKTHMKSKGHLEKMKMFNDNPEFYIEKFSKEFESGFLEILQNMFKNKKVLARTVYSEYCKILHHRHMNATKWSELEQFILHLREQKICEIENSPKGYFIQYLGEIKGKTDISKQKDDDLEEGEEPIMKEIEDYEDLSTKSSKKDKIDAEILKNQEKKVEGVVDEKIKEEFVKNRNEKNGMEVSFGKKLSFGGKTGKKRKIDEIEGKREFPSKIPKTE